MIDPTPVPYPVQKVCGHCGGQLPHHEFWCPRQVVGCGKCGVLGAHPEQDCPEFRSTSCCGADTLCRLCPLVAA